jgi:malate dehydrogenase
MRKKISVIGAGNVGREVAAWCAIKELGDVVLWNRSKEKAIGNALDLMEAGPIVGFDTKIIGTDNLNKTKNSNVIVFTAGFPRKPGMKREELVKTNADVVKPLIKKLAKLSPKAIIVMLTNPLDAMTYVAFKASKFPKKRVIGMAGVLDSSRFKSFISDELKVSRDEVSALVMGSHGENMVPLSRLASVGGVGLEDLLSKKKIEKLVKHTKGAGAEIVGLLKSNASFSVGASAAKVVESILKDNKDILPCSVYLQGEYGLKNIFIGVPCEIGSKGVEKIIEFKLKKDEKAQLHAAAKRINTMIKSLR